jgi:hypothetical protein
MILIIDGAWIRDQDSKQVSEAIERYFLNNTAIAIVNGPSDVLTSVLRNTKTNVSFENPWSESSAVCYAPGTKGAICFDLENKNTYQSTIVLYNWCVIQEAKL